MSYRVVQSPRSSVSSRTKTLGSQRSRGRAVEFVEDDLDEERTLRNGDRYEGGYLNGKRHGTGTYWFQSGAVYIGEWKHDRKHGHGKYYYTDGSIYDGEWESDRRDGYGLYVYRNGDKYEGEWMNHMRHGQGKYYYSKIGICFTGIWINDKKQPGGQSKKIAIRQPSSIPSSTRSSRRPYERPSDIPSYSGRGAEPVSRLRPRGTTRILSDMIFERPPRRDPSRKRSPSSRHGGKVTSLQNNLHLGPRSSESYLVARPRTQSLRDIPVRGREYGTVRARPRR